MAGDVPSLTLRPIGFARTPFGEKVQAPRQPRAAEGVRGRIDLLPGQGFEDALSDLEGWDFIWVIFWLHRAEGWRPKVLPPRSEVKRGLFATRSPHRPCPLGLSAVRLLGVEGLTLHVSDVDMLDGTPVLDIKPYVPWTDALPQARTGWLAPLSPPDGETPADPEPGFAVRYEEPAATQLDWLRDTHGVDLRPGIERVLVLGPQPHAYRRIRPDGDAMRLAVKDWRVRFRVDGRTLTVTDVLTGYRPRELWGEGGEHLDVHRAFAERFGPRG